MKHLTKYTIILLTSLTSIFGFAQTGSPIYDNVGENYFTQSPSGSDSLLQMLNSDRTSDNYWIKDNVNNPGDDFGGTVPTDIFYLEVPDGNDKIYVYGKRNIVIIDVVTQKTIDIIENISDFSQNYPTIEETQYLNYNHFAYNETDQMLYCAIENADMIAINTVNNEWELIETPWSQCSKQAYYNYFLKYDPHRNWIYFAISGDLADDLFIYDASDYETYWFLTFDTYTGNIRGLEINETEDEFYLSIDNKFERITYVHNTETGNTTFESEIIGEYSNSLNSSGNLQLLKWENELEEEEEKLFCFPCTGGIGITLNYFIFDLLNPNEPAETEQCPSKITAACFDGTDKVYISYVSDNDQADLRAIDVDDYSIETDVNTHDQTIDNTNKTLDLDIVNGKVLITKESEITMYDPISAEVTQVKSGENHYFSRIAVAPDALTAYAINTWGAGLDAIVDQAVPLEYSLNLGGIAYHACFNPYNGRIYFYNKHIQKTGKVYIFNTADNTFAIVEIDGPISDIEVYPFSQDKVLVSTYNGSHFLKVIQDDELMGDEDDWIELNHAYINEMYVSPEDPGLTEDYLYCVVGEQDGADDTGIEIGKFTTSGFSQYHFLTYTTSNSLKGYFTENFEDASRDEGHIVYAALSDGTMGIKKLLKISIGDPGSPPIVVEYDIQQNAEDIVFNNKSSAVYISHNYRIGTEYHHKVTVFSTKDASIETVVFPNLIVDIESNSLNDFIYVIQRGDFLTGSHIDKLTGTTKSSNPIVDLYSTISSMNFNANNSMLYVHVPFVKLDCSYGEGGVYEIFDNNTGNHYSTFIENGNKNRPRYFSSTIIPANHDIVFDNEAHRLFYGGGGHSNIQGLSIESFYQIPLDGDPVTWLSVPRHLRSDDPQLTLTSTVFAQDNITGGYTDLQLDHNEIIPGSPHQPHPVWAKWNSSLLWHYDDNEESIMKDIHSARGYKLAIEQVDPDNPYLELHGAVQNPNTVFPLYCHEENWAGYYLFEVQSVFNALGDALPYVYHVEHEDYTCYRYNFPIPNCNAKSANDNYYPPGTWICDGRPNIRFGDMVIVKPYKDIPDFKWHQSNYPPSDYTRSEVVYYTYDELADYSTFVIELDTTQENPEEMGAFINDTCVGACSVTEGDSVVVLRAYLGEQAGDSVVFEEHYESKSTNNINVTDYYVLNPESGLKEKRVVKTGEGRDVFIVSFRKGQKGNTPDLNSFDFNIWPNPASDNLFYSFILENDADVNISIFDIAGRLVSNPINEHMQTGNMNGEFSLSDFSGGKLKPGVYFVKLNTGDLLETKKVIVK